MLNNLIPETAEILKKVDQYFVGLILYGEPNRCWLIRNIALDLTPEELNKLMSDAACNGLYVEDKNERENLIGYAVWFHEFLRREKDLLEFSHYKLVREYGKNAVIGYFKKGEFHYQKLTAFKEGQTGRFVTVGSLTDAKPKVAKLGDALLNSSILKSYDYAEFLPDTDANIDTLNLWQSWKFADVKNNAAEEPENCKYFLQHLKDNVCSGNEEVYQYLLGWMADAVLYPNRTSRIAVVMKGPQGSGKSLFATLFSELFAPYTAMLSRPEQLTGQFNAHLMEKLVVFADEAFFTGTQQQAAALKTLVTSEEIFVEPKGLNGFMARKLFRLIIASNDEHVIKADSDDRRFLVLNVDAGKNNNSREYFQVIINEWKAGGAQALFSWLRGTYWQDKLESGEWSPEKRPKTRELDKQKSLSLNNAEMVVFNLLNQGEPPCGYLKENGKLFIPTRLLIHATKLSIKDEKSLSNAMRIIAVKGANGKPINVRRNFDSQVYRGFLIPPLSEARQNWEKAKGYFIDWPDDIIDWEAPINPIPPKEPDIF